MPIEGRQMWTGETLKASIANLRAGGKTDARIAQILGMTPEQAGAAGLDTKVEIVEPPARQPLIVPPAMPPELGPPPQLAWLLTTTLFVDDRYQRTVRQRGEKAIERMAKTFTWAKFQALTVADTGFERYAIVDGQFRWRAAVKRGDIPALPCLVVTAPQIADQARSFVGINTDRTAVTGLEVFWAGAAAGDITAQRYLRICTAADVEIARYSPPVLPARTTIATQAIGRLLKYGDAAVTEGLQMLALAQPAKPNIFKGATITAVVTLLATHGDRVDRERLLKTLEEFDVEEETRAAKAYRKVAGGTVDAALLTLITRAYNRRPGPGQLKEDAASPAQEAA